MNLMFSTNALPLYSQTSGTNIILLLWDGLDIDAACLSLCSAIQCLRGSQSSIGSFGHPILVTSVELVQAETGLSSLTD